VIRQRSGCSSAFRHLKSFLLVWVVLWCYCAWIHIFWGTLFNELDAPLSFIDRGHPAWLSFVDQKVEDALIRNQNLLFMQAVIHQLGGELEFARQRYEELSNDVRALNNLGGMVLDEKPEDARRYFERARQRNPDFAPAIYNLGVINGDHSLIERARASDPWRVNAYQKHASDKPWIAIFTAKEWSKTVYWSQGGFLVKGFTEIVRDFIKYIDLK
jgi:tetratricopeptide (TPR) repeat protein